MMLHYSIPEFKSTEQFLALIARKLGRLKKGARPDTNAAAKHVSFLLLESILLQWKPFRTVISLCLLEK